MSPINCRRHLHFSFTTAQKETKKGIQINKDRTKKPNRLIIIGSPRCITKTNQAEKKKKLFYFFHFQEMAAAVRIFKKANDSLWWRANKREKEDRQLDI